MLSIQFVPFYFYLTMNKTTQTINIILCLLWSIVASCQSVKLGEDELRGSITPERAWWDLIHYDLSVEIFPEKKSIKGTNVMSYTVLNEQNTLQLDLQEPMQIINVTQDGRELEYKRVGSAYFIALNAKQKKGTTKHLTIQWEGNPRIAKRPPWDGGITWKKDEKGRDFIATANQGIGASVWWPNKDHPKDEVDSLDMHITVPKGLINVSNGRLAGVDHNKTSATFHWTVKNPINNYGVNLNIGHYVNFSELEPFKGEKSYLDMEYWVLDYNLEKAREQFKQAPMMMEAFEHWFGPYPFYEDSFKLVEAPYLGMEHQSSVTYGNGFQNGYLGRDLSGTGQGLKFDFIIIHEAGHEWFANNITNSDVADMWIHEGFTCYSENLYLDYHFGKDASAEYVIGLRKNIQNDRPLIGTYNMNHRGSGDMYYKGANILHTLRTVVNDDELWRQTLRGLNKDFYHQTVSSKQVEEYIQEKLQIDLKGFFDQYLRATTIPTLEYRLEKNTLRYRFINAVDHFKLPVRVELDGEAIEIQATTQWQEISVPQDSIEVSVSDDYYFKKKK